MGAKNHVVTENGKIRDPMSVTWLEKYDEKFSKFWNRIPNNLRVFIATLATFLFGVSISGEFENFVVLWWSKIKLDIRFLRVG